MKIGLICFDENIKNKFLMNFDTNTKVKKTSKISKKL